MAIAIKRDLYADVTTRILTELEAASRNDAVPRLAYPNHGGDDG